MRINKSFVPIILLAFALMAPYIIFVRYLGSHYQPGAWPLWTTYTILFWFIGNLVFIALAARRILRGQVLDAAQAQQADTKKIASVNVRLVICWTLLLLWVLKETGEGKFQLSRAIPASIFLLLFIGIFGSEGSPRFSR